MANAESSEMGNEAWYEDLWKTGEFDAVVEKLSDSKRGEALDALVGAVGALTTGAPLAGTGAKAASRWLRERCEAATDRLLKEGERLDEEEAVEGRREAFARLVKHQLQPWLVLTLRELGELREDTEELKQTTLRTEAKVDELLQRVLAQTAAEKGVPIEPLRKVLERLGEAGVPFEQIPQRLEAVAGELLALRKQLASLQFPELALIRGRAKERLDEGDLVGARTLLAQAREQRELRLERDAREVGALLSDEAAIDRLDLRYRDAAQKWSKAADRVAFDVEAAAGYRGKQAGALYAQGEEFGDNDALRASVEVFRALLPVYPRERVPLQWAATQNNLGNALASLGNRERGTERLKQAVEAFQEALREWTRERVPLQWAATQNNLGNALASLGNRERGTERLKQAVEAFQEALREWTRERVPLQWAMTQNNLGNTLRSLGERESGTERLEQAVQAFQEALRERTRERVPLDWGTRSADHVILGRADAG